MLYRYKKMIIDIYIYKHIKLNYIVFICSNGGKAVTYLSYEGNRLNSILICFLPLESHGSPQTVCLMYLIQALLCLKPCLEGLRVSRSFDGKDSGQQNQKPTAVKGLLKTQRLEGSR